MKTFKEFLNEGGSWDEKQKHYKEYQIDIKKPDSEKWETVQHKAANRHHLVQVLKMKHGEKTLFKDATRSDDL